MVDSLDFVDLEEALEYLDVIEKETKNNTRIILKKFLITTVDSVSASALITINKPLSFQLTFKNGISN